MMIVRDYEEFLQEYVLNRAKTAPASLDGEVCAANAKAAWDQIQKYLEEARAKDVNTTSH